MIYPIHHLPDKIPVGVQTEQDVEDIGFDLKHWLAVFPDMVFTVWATRPGEQDAYPVNEQMLIGSVLYWHPDGYDTAIAGEGKVEIVGVGENRRKLSGFVPTAIHATSMGTTKEPGENTVPWYEKIINAAMEIAADVDVGAGGLYLVRVNAESCADRTQEEIREAVKAGKTCLLVHYNGDVYAYCGTKEYFLNPTGEPDCPVFGRAGVYETGKGIELSYAIVRPSGKVHIMSEGTARTPNPYKLTIGGQTYDGSKAVKVEIPEATAVYIVTVKWDTTADAWMSNRTQAEIAEASAAGKACFVHLPDIDKTLPLASISLGVPVFEAVQYSEALDELVTDRITINADKSASNNTFNRYAYPPTPMYNTNQTQYCRWNGSKWEAATIAQLKADLGLT